MIGSGKVLYHMTFVEDLARGFILAGERKESVGEIFTIGGEGYLTLGELVEKIGKTLNKRVPKTKIPVWPYGLADCSAKLHANHLEYHRRSIAAGLTSLLKIEHSIYPKLKEFSATSRRLH